MVVSFNWINEFALFISGAVIFQMGYRLGGTIWYRLEESFKFFWEKTFAWWCTCITCPWQRHRSNKNVKIKAVHPQRRMSDIQRHVGRVGKNIPGAGTNEEDRERDKDKEQEEDEDEAVWGRQSWVDYTGYGIVQGKHKYDPTTGKVHRKSQMIGWDQELDPGKLESLTGRRQSIFETKKLGQPAPSNSQPESISDETSHNESAQTTNESHERLYAGHDENGTMKTCYDGKDFEATRNYSQNSTPFHEGSISSCETADLEACLAEGERVVDALGCRLEDSIVTTATGDMTDSDQEMEIPLPYLSPDNETNLQNELNGDLRPLWRRKKWKPSLEITDLPANEVAKQPYPPPFEAAQNWEHEEDIPTYQVEEERGYSYDDGGCEIVVEEHDEKPKAIEHLPQHDGFLRRTLGSSELSYDEDESEFLALDCIPVTTHPSGKLICMYQLQECLIILHC